MTMIQLKNGMRIHATAEYPIVKRMTFEQGLESPEMKAIFAPYAPTEFSRKKRIWEEHGKGEFIILQVRGEQRLFRMHEYEGTKHLKEISAIGILTSADIGSHVVVGNKVFKLPIYFEKTGEFRKTARYLGLYLSDDI